jgi:hypothetical protein
MPDAAREIVFPEGVPIRALDGAVTELSPPSAFVQREPTVSPEPEIISTGAEADLGTDSNLIEKQARAARPADDEENLLAPKPAEKAKT